MVRILTILALLACAAISSAWEELLVVTTDYSAYGAVSTVGRHAPWTPTADIETINADAVARWHGGLYYVVNRGGPSNVQILDPALGLDTILQFSVGVGRNPQDIAFGADGHGWIPCYDEAVLLEVDPEGGTILGSYSTSEFADADGLPETSWTILAGDVLGIVCQRLDRNGWWGPADYSQILLFDLAARAWIDADPVSPGVQGLVLAGTNPSAMPEPVGDGRRARVASTGWFGLLDGGIETVDLIAGTTSGLQVTEAQLGGDIIDFVTVAVDRAYALVSDAAFRTNLVTFDPRDGSAVSTIVAAAGYDYVDLAWDGVDLVYLCDQTVGAAGVRVFAAATGVELTTAPVGVGRPPFMVVAPVDVTTSVSQFSVPLLTVAPPFPNPANPRTTVVMSAPPYSEIRLEVLDVRGRRIADAMVTADAGGRADWTWIGCDEHGRPAPSAVYHVRATSGAFRAETTLTLVR